MNDEKRRMGYFQPQPEGLDPILRPTTLSLACVEPLHNGVQQGTCGN